MTVPLSYHWESTSPGEDKTIPHFNAVGGMKAEQIGGRCNLYIFAAPGEKITRPMMESAERSLKTRIKNGQTGDYSFPCVNRYWQDKVGEKVFTAFVRDLQASAFVGAHIYADLVGMDESVFTPPKCECGAAATNQTHASYCPLGGKK